MILGRTPLAENAFTSYHVTRNLTQQPKNGDPMNILCPNCQRPLTVQEQYAGQMMKCPLCGGTFTVPALAPTPATPPVTPPSSPPTPSATPPFEETWPPPSP